ncbi:glycosyltransferase [Weissella confusa]|uniref:glycosyltransferase n=1 Tax=Weissella confusa TaxID=1583 RepID=UPI003983063E
MNQTISIFTTTRNRPALLSRLFESLIAQTNLEDVHVEWIIGVDGDSEGTFELAQKFDFSGSDWLSIKVREFSGIGKHKVLNRLQGNQVGDVTTIVDDDDYLAQDAIEIIMDSWRENPDAEEIVFLRGNEKTGLPVQQFPYDTYKGDVFDYRYRGNLVGDYFETYKTNLYNNYVFPEFDDERFISEGTKWQPMAIGSIGVFKNKTIYFADYRDDGLTKNVRRNQISNPKGVMLRQKQIIEEPKFKLINRIRALVMYSLFTNYSYPDDERVILKKVYLRMLVHLLSVVMAPAAYFLKKKTQ